jgi:hypothetical protein
MNKDVAKRLLKDNDSCAFSCMRAADALLTDAWFNWEPETVWVELHGMGVDVPVGNRDQLLAGRSIVTTGRFIYDAVVFDKTAISFNNEYSNFDGLEDAPVEYIAWANEEAYRIHLHYTGSNFEYDREPVAFTAVQLQQQGYVYAPEQLHWAQAALDKYYPESVKELKKRVATAWSEISKADLKDHPYPETALGVQLAKLAAVQLHFNEKKARLLRELTELGA